MKVLVAPQEFKGTLSASEACGALCAGISAAQPGWHLTPWPIADGGAGTLDLVARTGARVHERRSDVEDALGRKVRARWLIINDDETAVIEMAQAAGTSTLANGPRVLEAATRGVGQLIVDALEAGCRRIIVTAGGSTTHDLGAGALTALGARFLDANGNELDPSPRALDACVAIDRADLHPLLTKAELEVWGDVRAPLLGPQGAARMFAAQKGASPHDIERLERLTEQFVARFSPGSGSLPGGGAAGGLAWGLHTWLQAGLHPGFLSLASLIGLGDQLPTCEHVVTGEGRLDEQSRLEKGPWALASIAKKHGVPTTLFTGSSSVDQPSSPFAQLVLVGPSSPLDAAKHLEAAAHAWASRYGHDTPSNDQSSS